MATFAPPSARSTAAARPMPREAPVTIATLFSKSFGMAAAFITGRVLREAEGAHHARLFLVAHRRPGRELSGRTDAVDGEPAGADAARVGEPRHHRAVAAVGKRDAPVLDLRGAGEREALLQDQRG